MGTSLVAIKDELHSLARVQMFKDVLAPYRLPFEAWRAGFLMPFEASKYLLDNVDLNSVISSAMTISVLGLRNDSATGQSCIVPFASKAQPIVMVQGYTVIAGRGGYTLQSRLVREGDVIKEVGGSDPGIVHEPKLGSRAKVIGTYAVARSKLHPVLFTPFMGIDEIIEVRDRSQGYKSALNRGKKHPWMSDFDAMMLKTPKRRLAKDIPNDQLAAANWLETQHDIGRLGWLQPNGLPVEERPAADESPFPERQPGITDVEDLSQAPREPAPLVWILPDGSRRSARTIEDWSATVGAALAKQTDVERLQAARERNKEVMNALMVDHPDHVLAVFKIFNDKGAH